MEEIINTPSSPALVIREKMRETPYVYINAEGIIKISGDSIAPNIRKFFLSLFWGINKIINNKVTATIDLGNFNAATIRHLFIFFRILTKHQPVNEIVVFWFYDDFDEECLELGKMFQEQLPEISFMFFLR